jgi:hypothetical protein
MTGIAPVIPVRVLATVSRRQSSRSRATFWSCALRLIAVEKERPIPGEKWRAWDLAETARRARRAVWTAWNRKDGTLQASAGWMV